MLHVECYQGNKNRNSEIPLPTYCAALSCSVVSDYLWPHGLSQRNRLLCPWGFPRQKYWSGLPCPPPGDLPNPGIEPGFPTLQADSLPAEPPGKPPHLLKQWKSRTLISSAGKVVEQQKLLLITGENTECYSQLQQIVWQFLTKLNILLPCCPFIALLGIYSKDLKT